MDASAFEADAPDGPPVSVAAELQEMAEEAPIEIKLLFAAACALVKVLWRFTVLLVALAAYVVIILFVLSWHCLLWLQMQLLFGSSYMLRLTMGATPRVQLVDSETVHEPEASSDGEQVQEETEAGDRHESEPAVPAPAEDIQPVLNNLTKPLNSDHAEALNVSNGPQRPPLPAEWTTGEAGRHDANADLSTAAMDRPEDLQRRNNDLPNGIVEPWAHDKYNGGHEYEHDGSRQEHGGFMDTETRRLDENIKPEWQPEPRGTFTNPPHRLSATHGPSKPSKESGQAQEQQAWTNGLNDDLNSRSRPIPSRPEDAFTSTTDTHRNEDVSRPTCYSQDQIDAAKEFARQATRGGEKKKFHQPSRSTNTHPQPAPLTNTHLRHGKPGPSNQATRPPAGPATLSTPSRVRSAQPAMLPKGDATPSPSGPASSAANSSQSSTSGLAPHMKKRAMEAASQASPSEIQAVSATASPAPWTGQTQALATVSTLTRPTERKNVDKDAENLQPADQLCVSQAPESVKQPVESPEWRPTPSTGTEHLDFYKVTPPLTNPAQRAMSIELLKMFGAAMPSVSQAPLLAEVAARLQRSDAASLVSKPAISTSQLPKGAFAAIDPFTTPPEKQFRPSRKDFSDENQTGNELVDLGLDDGSSAQQSFPSAEPSAEEFEAVEAVSRRRQEHQQRVGTEKPGSQNNAGNADKSSPTNADLISITQQAVRVLEDQAHAKRASTSTYVTPREEPTLVRNTEQQDSVRTLIDADTSNVKESSAEKTRETPGKKPSKLNSGAPAFFAPPKPPAQPAPTPDQAYPSPIPSSFTTAPYQASPYNPYGSTVSPLAPSITPVNVPQAVYPSAPTASPFQHGPVLANPYGPAPGMLPLTPQSVPGYMSTANMQPLMPQPAVPTMPCPTGQPPSMVHFPPPLSHTPHPSGIPHDHPLRYLKDAVPSRSDESYFQGGFENSGMAALGVAGSPFQLSNNQLRPPIPNAPHTVPVRRQSLAIPIMRPPAPAVSSPALTIPAAPIRSFDVQSERDFPPLSSAPAPAPVQARQVSKPPGLGEAQPRRQAAFDALLSEPSPRTPVTKSESQAVGSAAGSATSVADATQLVKEPNETEPTDEAQPEPPPSVKSREDTDSANASDLDLPQQQEDGNASSPQQDSSFASKDTEDEVAIAPTEGFSSSDAEPASEATYGDGSTSPQRDEPSAAKQKTDDTTEPKPSMKQERRATRKALLEVWCKRENARSKYRHSYSVPAGHDLKDTTQKYNEARHKLACLMASGKLNEEDARVFPGLRDDDTSPPKALPVGSTEIRHKLKEEEKAAQAAAGDAEKSPDGSKFEEALTYMESARQRRREALKYFTQARPQSNIKYATWKKKGDGQLERANKYYRSRREGLLALCPDELRDEMMADFPSI